MTHNIRSNKDLFAYNSKHGTPPEYIFFWGGELSQWYPSDFTYMGTTYTSAEHYMMVHKALTFNDHETADIILQPGTSPAFAKKMGKKVKNFNEDAWNNVKFDIVIMGNCLKFEQNEYLRKFLLATNDAVLVEASPYDRIWGIGMGEDEFGIENATNWKGQNLLGYAIMEAREYLRKTNSYLTSTKENR